MVPPLTVAGPGQLIGRDELRIGPLLAEGGEGRVFQLPRQPHLVYKAYRQPVARGYLEQLVTWPLTLTGAEQARLGAAAAWPGAVVTERGGRPAGVLMSRAPRRFALRHRDGRSRLASLSYLTADPAQRAAAYGLELPAPASPARLGLVYGLARLLETLEGPARPAGHGDLSTKNVLWSLQRGPEVFVIDCDNSEIFEADGSVGHSGGRRRAMTPNWDDPAVPRGSNPTAMTDRYSLGLIFLRVVGAANFPVQARQRAGGPIRVEFPVPAGEPTTAALLDPMAPVWRLCARALSVTEPAGRPHPGEWAEELERLLRRAGAGSVIDAVTRAQTPGVPVGGGQATAGARQWPAPVGEDAGDVEVVPVRAPRRPAPVPPRTNPAQRYGPPTDPGGGLLRPPGSVRPGAEVVTGVALWPEVRTQGVRAARWWWHLHLSALRSAFESGRRPAALRALVMCAAVDVVVVSLGAIVVAMIVAPVLGL